MRDLTPDLTPASSTPASSTLDPIGAPEVDPDRRHVREDRFSHEVVDPGRDLW